MARSLSRAVGPLLWASVGAAVAVVVCLYVLRTQAAAVSAGGARPRLDTDLNSNMPAQGRRTTPVTGREQRGDGPPSPAAAASQDPRATAAGSQATAAGPRRAPSDPHGSDADPETTGTPLQLRPYLGQLGLQPYLFRGNAPSAALAPSERPRLRALVCGHFSNMTGGTTAGDIMAADVAAEWLLAAGVPFDVVLNAAFAAVSSPVPTDAVWQETVPAERWRSYGLKLAVCGPFDPAMRCSQVANPLAYTAALSVSFAGLRTHVSVPEKAYDYVVARDRNDSAAVTVDLAILSEQPKVPVVGLILMMSEQREFSARSAAVRVNDLCKNWLEKLDVAVVPISTALHHNPLSLRTPSAIESLVARMDVVVTTRLHGLVLAIKNAVPVVAIDPIPGGAKVAAQARALGWPGLLTEANTTVASLQQMLDWALTPQARALAAARRNASAKTALRQRDDAIRWFSKIAAAPKPLPGGLP